VRVLPAGYQEIFSARGGDYNRAMRLCPAARETERRLLLDALDARPGDLVCDVPAGGGYVAEGVEALGSGAAVICVEPAAPFARGIPSRFSRVVSTLDRISLRARSVDRVASLTGLHHLESKAAFAAEAARILRPRGRFAVADVAEGSDVARFLNGSVDRLSVTGHAGSFLARGELASLLADAGFRDVSEHEHRYHWTFADFDVLIAFFRELFGLAGATDGEVRAAVTGDLHVDAFAQGVRVSWSLVYASGNKPA
jgi:ubiquinone/menaquinone biosynthesis C-methylase UbiE